ncbi:MAG: VCBS domain-containing protein, partial [Alphaproteobacteria bacterium]|nr:VCBS domain-containing protein [Alphaproteobacteria bacterium]
PPFDIGGIGPGLIPEGPLAPTGFGITTEFLKGVGGGNSTPPGPPGPPPPPPGEHLIVPDLDTLQYQLGDPNFLGAAPHTGLPVLAPHNVGGTSYTIDVTGNYITDIVASSPAAFITDFWTPGSPPPAFGTHASPGGTLNGQFGTFTIDSAGNYDYQLSAASEHTLSQLGTDIMSQAVNQPFHTYQAGFQDVFDIATSNGFESAGTTPADIKQIQFDFYAANVAAAAASIPTVTPAPASATSMLLTYTDAVDPGHSFQQLVTVDTTGHVVVTPEGGSTIVQPNDPALVTLEYLSGSGANVSSVTIEGESFNIGATIGPGQHAYSAVINPALDTLGDNGDTGSASAAAASQDSGTGLTPLGTFNDTALSGISGTFGYLFDSGNTSANGAGRADAVNYADTSDAATLNGSTTAGATSVIEWSSTATIDGNTHIDGAPGSTAATGGLNVLEIESSTLQNLDFTSTLSSDPTSGNIKNVEVFDLTDGAHSSVANSITLTANDVFQLAEHEPTAIQNAGGAAALWILGGTNDTVNLAGTGSTWTQISAPVTQTGQAGGNPSQMVGFTEFAATTTGGQAVHVYVQNAIQNAGHVAHA